MNRFALVLLAALLPACTSGDPQASPSPSATVPSSASPSASPTATPSVSATVARPVSSTVSPSPATAPLPAGFSPRSVSFVSPTKGWALGATGQPETLGTVAATSDGGRTWSKAGTIPVVAGDAPGRRRVHAIRFFSDTVGWAYGGAAFVTRDGGATWREAALPGGRAMASIAASGTETYAVLGTIHEDGKDNAAVWKGKVGADTFTRVDAANSFMPSDDELVVRGRTVFFESGRGFRVSNDAGRTWATRLPCASDQNLRDAAASSERDVVFFCEGRFPGDDERTLRVSRDGGRTSTVRLREPDPGYRDIQVATATATTVTRVLDAPGSDDDTLQWSSDGGRTFRAAGPAGAPQGMSWWQEPRYLDASFGTILRRVSEPRALVFTAYVTRDSGKTWEPLPIK